MGFFGKLLGTEKALDSVVRSVSNGIDALVHTDEEKSKEAAADRSEARKMLIRWMESTQGQNLARRIIALSITFVWLMQYVLSVVVGIYVNPENATTILQTGAEQMSSAVLLILSFYFAAPHMGDIIKSVKLGKRDSERVS